MKLNWGWGITIFVLIFVTFILSLVYRCSQQQVDLVSEKYYENEIKFQQHINREKNTNSLTGNISLIESDSLITIQYPEAAGQKKISGDIEFFKPDNAHKDLRLAVNADSGLRQQVKLNALSKGYWDVKINWSVDSMPYYFEKRILVN